MTFEFDYKKEFSSLLGEIFRPVAKVQFLNKNGEWISEYMYVDSGADFTLIPYKLGEFLGFEIEDHRIIEVQGINGVVSVMPKKIKMKIGDHEFEAQVGWCQIEEVPLLLGRTNVFDEFNIEFCQKEKKTKFKR